MIGERVSHYRILDKLGGGGMGVVYKAQDRKLDRLVAIKFLPIHASDEDESSHRAMRERFEQEAKAASALDHANIGTITYPAASGNRPQPEKVRAFPRTEFILVHNWFE